MEPFDFESPRSSRRAVSPARKAGLFALSVLAGAFIALSSGWGNSLRAALGAATVTPGPKIMQPAPKPAAGKEIAVLAGGCFWSEQAIFTRLRGVDDVKPGYAGGSVAKPTYEQVCSESTGHAETVRVTFDPKVISYHELLTVFLTTIDPTTLNRQGADEGASYRSAIFYLNPEQKATAQQVIKEIDAKKTFSDPIVTSVEPFSNFYPAEAYHNNYYALHPDEGYCRAVIAPKVAHFQEKYPALLK